MRTFSGVTKVSSRTTAPTVDRIFESTSGLSSPNAIPRIDVYNELRIILESNYILRSGTVHSGRLKITSSRHLGRCVLLSGNFTVATA